MATPMVIIPQLEGMVGTMPQGNEAVQTWLEMVKFLLRSQAYRNLDDLQLAFVPAITDVGIVVSTDATHVIADCWEIAGDLGTDTSVRCGMTDADSDTIDITAAITEDVILNFTANDLATAGVYEFYPHIYLAGASGIEAAPGTYSQTGIALTTGLTAWADGMDGNAATAASVRALVLYRT